MNVQEFREKTKQAHYDYLSKKADNKETRNIVWNIIKDFSTLMGFLLIFIFAFIFGIFTKKR